MSSRNCTVCELPIPEARIAAVPGATHCVPCLEAAGDVPRIKRFDEATRESMVETYYTNDPYVERAHHRQNVVTPGDEWFEAAVGDDQFLEDAPYSAEAEMPSTFGEIEEMVDVERARGRDAEHHEYMSVMRRTQRRIYAVMRSAKDAANKAAA